MTARLVYIRKWPTFLTSCLASPFKLEARGRCHQSHSLVSTISPLSHGRVHWTSRNGKRRSQFATLKWKKQTKKTRNGGGKRLRLFRLRAGDSARPWPSKFKDGSVQLYLPALPLPPSQFWLSCSDPADDGLRVVAISMGSFCPFVGRHRRIANIACSPPKKASGSVNDRSQRYATAWVEMRKQKSTQKKKKNTWYCKGARYVLV